MTPAAKPSAVFHPKRQAAPKVKIAPRISKNRSILGMAAEKKRSAAVSVGVEAMVCCVGLGIRLVAGKRSRHSDHLRKTDDGAENHSAKIEPVSMKPVIAQPANCVSQKNRRRNNKSYFRIAGRRNQGIRRLGWRCFSDTISIAISVVLIIFRHDGMILSYARSA